MEVQKTSKFNYYKNQKTLQDAKAYIFAFTFDAIRDNDQW